MKLMMLTFLIGCHERDMLDYANCDWIKPREKKRTVHILLTEKQMEELGLKQVGVNCGKPMIETVLECFVEPEPDEL
jgi:hypothetical protein